MRNVSRRIVIIALFVLTFSFVIFEHALIRINAQSQTEFGFDVPEVKLTEPEFKATAKLIGNAVRLSEVLAEDCTSKANEDVVKCTFDRTSGTVDIELLKDKFYNVSEKVVMIEFTQGDLTASLSVIVPPRIIVDEVLIGDKVVGSDSRVELIAKDKSAPITAKYKVDGSDKTDIELFSDSKSLKIDGGTIEGLSTSQTEIALVEIRTKGWGKVVLPQRRLQIEIRPRIKTIVFPSGNRTIAETDNQSIDFETRDHQSSIVTETKDIACSPKTDSSSDFKNAVRETRITPDHRIYISTGSLERTNSGGTPRADKVAGKIECTAKYTTDPVTSSFELTIEPKTGYLTVDSLNGNTLLPNGKLSFLTRVFKTNGQKVAEHIDYVLENRTENEQWVTLTSEGEKLTVNWINLPRSPGAVRPSFVTIRAFARPEAGHAVETIITVHMASVAKFSSLKVKLNLMDDRTAGDLYGNVTKDEYYVLMVRLFNDLKDRDANRYTGESILAYSSSIEVAVELEKKFDGDAESGNLGAVFDKKQMRELELERKAKGYDTFKRSLDSLDETFAAEYRKFEELSRDAIKKETEALRLESEARSNRKLVPVARRARQQADQAYEEIIAVRNRLRNLYRYNVVTLPKIPLPDNVAINDGKWYPAGRDDLMQVERQEAFLSPDDDDSIISISDNEPNCVDTITYRPFTFEMMVNTVDRRDERTLRSRIFKLMKLAGFGLSTVTAVAVPPATSDLPLGIEKFGNVLVPGLEELFPNLKEQHRQNIVSQTMKPIEEIPFGSDITRVVFIPKKPIKGLIDGHKARISQICPFYFKVKVAVVSKGGDVVLGNPIP